MKDSIKFWVSSLGIPIVLAVVGYMINNSLQENQQALDKIKFSDQMITEVFDTSDVSKSLARVELLPDMIDDKKFVKTLTNLVVNFWLEKAKEAASEGNDSIFEKIYSASKNFKQQGGALKDSIEKNKETMEAQRADTAEQTGLHWLKLGNLTAARKRFEYASSEHKAFSSNDSILKFLKNGIDTITDSSVEAKKILNKVKTQYAWKFHSAKPSHTP
jgi:hypothetical protein